MYEQTRQQIRALSNDALVEYLLAGTQTYEPEPVAFAWQELERRNLGADQVARIADAADQRLRDQEELARQKAAIPLRLSLKLMAYFLGLITGPIVGALVIGFSNDYFTARGNTQKCADFAKCAAIGFVANVIFLIWVASQATIALWGITVAMTATLAWIVLRNPPKIEQQGFSVVMPENNLFRTITTPARGYPERAPSTNPLSFPADRLAPQSDQHNSE